MVQGGRWGAVLRPGGRHFQPAWQADHPHPGARERRGLFHSRRHAPRFGKHRLRAAEALRIVRDRVAPVHGAPRREVLQRGRHRQQRRAVARARPARLGVQARARLPGRGDVVRVVEAALLGGCKWDTLRFGAARGELRRRRPASTLLRRRSGARPRAPKPSDGPGRPMGRGPPPGQTAFPTSVPLRDVQRRHRSRGERPLVHVAVIEVGTDTGDVDIKLAEGMCPINSDLLTSVLPAQRDCLGDG